MVKSGHLIPTLILNDTRVDHHHGCTRVMEAVESLLVANGCHVVGRVPAHVDWQSHPQFLAIQNDVRLVVVNGEGTLHHDRPAGRRLLEVGAWARSQGIPAVLVNAGWEANGAEMLAKLEDFTLVAVRDSRSTKQLHEAGIHCITVPDLSLYLPYQSKGGCRKGIGLTDSVDRGTTLRLDLIRREMQARWVPIHSRQAGIRERWKFMRGAIARRDIHQPGMALAMLHARCSMSSRWHRTVDAFMDDLAGLELLVSGRFHACTLALVSGTPFVATPSNTTKIEAMVEDVGLQPWRVDANLSAGDLLDTVRMGWDRQEQANILDYVDSARTGAAVLFHEVGALA